MYQQQSFCQFYVEDPGQFLWQCFGHRHIILKSYVEDCRWAHPTLSTPRWSASHAKFSAPSTINHGHSSPNQTVHGRSPAQYHSLCRHSLPYQLFLQRHCVTRQATPMPSYPIICITFARGVLADIVHYDRVDNFNTNLKKRYVCSLLCIIKSYAHLSQFGCPSSSYRTHQEPNGG